MAQPDGARRILTARLESPFCGCRWGGWGKGIVRELGMDVYSAVFKMVDQQGPAQGTLLSVMRQPGGEGTLGENGYMCMYG